MFHWAKEMNGITFLFFAIFLATLLYYNLTRSQTTKLNLPPSPSKLPVIGNLHQLGALPHRSLQSLAKKHGPLMLLHLGQTPTLIVSSADAAKEIMKTHDLNFANRPRVRFAEKLLYNNKDLAFSPYGEYWRQVRKISVLQLLSAHRVESFRSVREEEARLMINKIRSSTQSVVNISETIFSFTCDVVCRVALGRKFGEDEGGKKFWKMIHEYLFFIGIFNIADFIPWLSFVNNFNGYNARLENTIKDLDCFFEKVIEEHIQSRNKNVHANDHKGMEDFVDVLLGLENDYSVGDVPFEKDNIKALILDIFSAGTDTSSSTLVWAMTELIKHPEIMKEVQKEIREIIKGKPHITEDDLGEMQYLKLVIKETLRLHAPAPLLLPRESIKDINIMGYDIPAKSRVFINSWAIARDPMCWDKPEEFQPKRFLNSSVDYKGTDFELIPFGAGRRGCPGIMFATPNMELPLANLLYHFDWTLPDGAPRGDDIDVSEASGTVSYKKAPLFLVPTLRLTE